MNNNWTELVSTCRTGVPLGESKVHMHKEVSKMRLQNLSLGQKDYLNNDYKEV
jgi:hypothetical protein